jgi:hypothetical protein
MLVQAPREDNIYPVESFYKNGFNLESFKTDVKVYANNDGTVSLKCIDIGLFATWTKDGRDNKVAVALVWLFAYKQVSAKTCCFSLVVGSITDLQFCLLSLDWGDPEENLPSRPDQVDEDKTNKFSNTTMKTTSTVKYEGTTIDKTIWDHAWGFEFSSSAEFKAKIPIIGG